ncbi:unnamed protein product [Choristocarpus tenellus]
MGIALVGELWPCTGCSMIKNWKKVIPSHNFAWGVKKMDRISVALSRKKSVPSLGHKRYTMIVRDDNSNFISVFFLQRKAHVTEAFAKYLADNYINGVPSLVMALTSGDGGEFMEGEFCALCRGRGIVLEYTTADSPQYSRSAGNNLAMVENASVAARNQIPALFRYMNLASIDNLWAEASQWACDAINRTATFANPKCKSPYEMWNGATAPL